MALADPFIITLPKQTARASPRAVALDQGCTVAAVLAVYTRFLNSSVRVSISIMSPVLTNAGTGIS